MRTDKKIQFNFKFNLIRDEKCQICGFSDQFKTLNILFKS